MGIIGKAGLYGRTLCHFEARQIAWRLRYTLQDALGLRKKTVLPAKVPTLDATSLAALASFMQLWQRSLGDGDAEAGIPGEADVCFLNHSVSFEGGLPWGRSDLPRLWRYHLHYFEYARAAALQDVEEAVVRDWLLDWIAKNPCGTDVAWDAFTVASRLINWACVFSMYSFDDETIYKSYAQQAAYLADNVEYDIGGNHLLKDAVGLVVAGSLLGEPFLAKGLALLEEQLGEQILEDGGHYERSAMYHAIVLEDCLVAYSVLSGEKKLLRDSIELQATYLAKVCHSDGDIPLFGDAALGASTKPSVLLKVAHALCDLPEATSTEESYALAASGFYVLAGGAGRSRMIVKAGAAGPAYQLGHAHCDALSYEMTVGTRRVIVDSGVEGYAESTYRDYCRSTRAHNTVSVDGREQMECWATFRVGRRYRMEPVLWGSSEGGRYLRGAHDGFHPVRHARTVYDVRGDCWVVADSLSGPNTFSVDSYIHFCAGLEVEDVGGGWRVRGDGVDVGIMPFGVERVTVICGAERPQQGWYCPEFGRAIAAPVLCLRPAPSMEVCFGYAIFPDFSRMPTTDAFAEILGGLDPVPPGLTL